MDVVVDACWEFLEYNLSLDTCVMTWCLADNELHQQPRLAKEAKDFIFANIGCVAEQFEFLELDYDKFVQLLGANDIYVEQEESILEAIVNWLSHDSEYRSRHFAELLQYVRLPQISEEILDTTVVRLKAEGSADAADILYKVSKTSGWTIPQYAVRKSDGPSWCISSILKIHVLHRSFGILIPGTAFVGQFAHCHNRCRSEEF
ncbi:kelch-like protein diablo [Paramacrobiotus metropolitanus]|uniref:kelch-like protein diablo n=1 Tax=Paramacrobiotus metropolitanus TaxID=2943436 RepID=UPI002446437A|nr:kelch-like protein diablo [Paramacrobiotus metropolitanus]